MMPPRNWLRAVLGLRMRPQSNEPSTRLTRVSAVTVLTRTSQKIALCECIDQCISSSGGDACSVTVDAVALGTVEDRRVAFPPAPDRRA